MDNDVLLHDALVVAAPGDEGHIVAAPGAKLLHGVGKGDALGQTLLVKAGDFFHLVVHTAEVHGLDVHGKFLARLHVLRQLDGADLDDLSPEMDGELVENGGLGAHCLIPLQIHHNVIHSIQFLFLKLVKRKNYYNIFLSHMHYFFSPMTI